MVDVVVREVTAPVAALKPVRRSARSSRVKRQSVNSMWHYGHVMARRRHSETAMSSQ